VLPAHGPAITSPAALIETYLAHRAVREQQILRAVTDGHRTPAAIVETVYPGLDPELTGAAADSVQAHLDKLEHEGRLEHRSGEWWHLDAGR
jgi:hypothetical protein